MRLILAVLLLFPSCLAHAQTLIAQAHALDLRFQWNFVARGIEGPCGQDWYAHEQGYRLCFRYVPASGRLEVYRFEPLPAELRYSSTLRGPIPGDRRLLLAPLMPAGGEAIHAYDPVTNQYTVIGEVPQIGSASMFRGPIDYEGDGHSELLITGGNSTRALSLPGAPGGAFQILTAITEEPWNSATVFPGQFDSDARTELAQAVGSQLRFLDLQSQQLEPFAPTIPLNAYRYVGDWDADGVDELAMPAPDQFHLIDPNRTPPVYASAPAALAQLASGFGRVDWTGAGSHQLVARSREGYKVFDPRTGVVLADFPFFDTLESRSSYAVDWEADGDGDALFLREDSALLLLRNPDGPQLVQRRSVIKYPLGHTLWMGSVALVSAELYGTEPYEVRLALRDPDSLERLADLSLDVTVAASTEVLLGDFHPQAGPEVLIGDLQAIHAYSVQTGQALWSRSLPLASGRQFRGFAVADGDCVAQPNGCRRVAVLEISEPGGTNTVGTRPLLLDGSDGQVVWNGPADGCASCRTGAIALTDLDDDGQREVLYSVLSVSDGVVRALDPITSTMRWEAILDLEAARIVRTSGPVRRLAVVDRARVLSYLQPATGEVLRSRLAWNASPQVLCVRQCQLDYLEQGSGAGMWMVYDGDSGRISLIRHDFRGEIEVLEAGFGERVTREGNEVVGTSEPGLTRYSVERDGLFSDEFEGW